MLKFSRRETFGQSSASMRMDRAMRIGSDRKCEMDQPLYSSVKRARLAGGSTELLNGGPHGGVLIGDVLWRRR
jgi:hypothetical protein